MVAIGNIERAEQWTHFSTFYAFDIAVPGTVTYSVHHSIRSIYSMQANVPRHRITTDDARNPWEFRMHINVFPAALEDCTIITDF